MSSRQCGLGFESIRDRLRCRWSARDDAKLIQNTDPELKSERGQALRTLLYLLERDEAVRPLRSG